MALSAAAQRTYEVGDLNTLPMKANCKIYQGSAVSLLAAGTCNALVAGEKFAGFAIDTYDNTGGAASAKDATMKHSGYIVLTVASLAATTQIGVAVAASDDNTFTLVTSGNTKVGVIHRVLSGATQAVVAFDADVLV